MKKILCLLISLTMLFCIAAPVSAAAQPEAEAYDGYPFVVVRGIDFGGLYLEDKSPAISVGIGDIFALVKALFTDIIVERDKDKFIDSALTVVADVLDPIAMDKEGNPVHEVYFDKYENSMAYYPGELAIMEDVGETGIIKTASELIGAENVYYFTYDWRKSAKEIAADLDKYINKVLADTHRDKVNISAVSMGGMVATAYLYWHGAEKVNNLVYVSSAHNGTHGPGDAFNGNIYINGDTIYSRLRQSSKGSFFKCFFVEIAEKIGIFDAVSAVANKILVDNPKALNNEVIRNGFGTLLGFWAMCPDDVFEGGVEFMLGGHEDEYPVLMDKINETKEFIFSTEDIIDSAIKSGVNVAFISNYNSPLAPYFPHSDRQGDGVIETELTSNFATVALYGETLTDEQLAAAEEKYVSPDKIVDATTANYRDFTWFVKDAAHVAAEYRSDFAYFVLRLALAEEQLTVESDSRYPQFMLVDENKNLLIAE